MVHAMDRGIGDVMKALDEHGLRQKTIVFFLSDNGGPTFANASRNDPLRGDKGDVFEGGIRVPFIVSWPGTIPEGKVYDHPVISIDVSRTALELGGAKIVPKLEGVNLVPFLSGSRTGPPHEALFWRKDDGTDWAVRAGDTKLLRVKSGSSEELFDLSGDIAEERDLLSARAESGGRLKALYEEWNAGNAEPTFPSYRIYHQRKGEFYEGLEFERTTLPSRRK